MARPMSSGSWTCVAAWSLTFTLEATQRSVPVGDLLMVLPPAGRMKGCRRPRVPPNPIALDSTGRGGLARHWRGGAGAARPGPAWRQRQQAQQIAFGGGDGWLRLRRGRSLKLGFDGNPKDARWLPRPGVLSRSFIIASPVFAGGRVFVAMGQSPEHGNAPSLIHAISPSGQGDVTASRLLWTSREVGRVVATPIEKDGLLYVGDVGGMVHCLDAATGTRVWEHDTYGAIWGSFLLAGDRLYVGNEDGTMTILRTGRQKELLGKIEMDGALYSLPSVIGDALWLTTSKRLYLIATRP